MNYSFLFEFIVRNITSTRIHNGKKECFQFASSIERMRIETKTTGKKCLVKIVSFSNQKKFIYVACIAFHAFLFNINILRLVSAQLAVGRHFQKWIMIFPLTIIPYDPETTIKWKKCAFRQLTTDYGMVNSTQANSNKQQKKSAGKKSEE